MASSAPATAHDFSALSRICDSESPVGGAHPAKDVVTKLRWEDPDSITRSIDALAAHVVAHDDKAKPSPVADSILGLARIMDENDDWARRVASVPCLLVRVARLYRSKQPGFRNACFAFLERLPKTAELTELAVATPGFVDALLESFQDGYDLLSSRVILPMTTYRGVAMRAIVPRVMACLGSDNPDVVLQAIDFVGKLTQGGFLYVRDFLEIVGRDLAPIVALLASKDKECRYEAKCSLQQIGEHCKSEVPSICGLILHLVRSRLAKNRSLTTGLAEGLECFETLANLDSERRHVVGQTDGLRTFVSGLLFAPPTRLVIGPALDVLAALVDYDKVNAQDLLSDVEAFRIVLVWMTEGGKRVNQSAAHVLYNLFGALGQKTVVPLLHSLGSLRRTHDALKHLSEVLKHEPKATARSWHWGHSKDENWARFTLSTYFCEGSPAHQLMETATDSAST